MWGAYINRPARSKAATRSARWMRAAAAAAPAAAGGYIVGSYCWLLWWPMAQWRSCDWLPAGASQSAGSALSRCESAGVAWA
eukprot:COSAG01_NODE_6895_length_3448_cov_3.556285_3_plen_82_part_00